MASHSSDNFKLPNYEHIRVLGKGGVGRVVLARRHTDNRFFAIKTLLNPLNNPEQQQRLLKEAKMLAGIDHPNLVKVREHGLHDGRPFAVMDYIPGQNLDDIVKEQLVKEQLVKDNLPDNASSVTPFVEDELVTTFEQLASAIQHLHERGISHRDVKPSNVFIDTQRGRLLLGDLGLAKRSSPDLESHMVSLTQTGQVLGSPRFMAPEQISAKEHGDTGPWTDAWGFGTTLFYALTGETPVTGKSQIEVFSALVSGRVRAPKTINPRVPDWLNRLVLFCLLKDPEQRPSMSQVLEVLRSRGQRGLPQELSRAIGEPSSKLWPVTLFACLLVLGGLVAALVAVLRKPQADWLRLDDTPSYTDNPDLLIAGQLTNGPCTVKVAGQSIDTDRQGRFKFKLPLKEGLNDLVLSIADQATAKTKTRQVVLDSQPPRLEVANLAVSDPYNKSSFRLADDWRLAGRVIDDNPESITIQGMPTIALSRDGAFSVTFPKRSFDEIQTEPRPLYGVTVKDKAGNVSRHTLQLLAPESVMQALEKREAEARQNFALSGAERRKQAFVKKRGELWLRSMNLKPEQRSVWLSMTGLRLWQQAGPLVRKAAAEAVQERLGDSFQSLGLKTFKCGEQSFDVPVFVHRDMALRFHLIPGGPQEITWWSNPDMDFVVQFTEIFVSGQFNSQMLYAFLRNPPYDNAREILAKAFKVELISDSSKPKDELDEANTQRLCRYLRRNQDSRPRLRQLLKQHSDFYAGQTPHKKSWEYSPPFLLARTETPVAVWQPRGKLSPPMEAMIKRLQASQSYRPESTPVAFVTLEDVLTWIYQSNKSLSVPVRLPSFIEWMWACAGGSKAPFPWGQSFVLASQYGAFKSLDEPEPPLASSVKRKDLPNAFGLLDMLGNVEEWADPLWNTWARRVDGILLQQELQRQLDQVRSCYALMGGSIFWYGGNPRTRLMHVKGDQHKFGIRGFRLAVSIPVSRPRGSR